MRKYKFRGKRIVSGAWVVGDLLQTNEGSVCIGVHGQYIDDGMHFNDMYNETPYVDEDTIGQFSGRIDGKGNEIYEGDIVESYVVFITEDEETIEFWRVGEIRYIGTGFVLTNCTNYDDPGMKNRYEMQPNPKSRYSFPAYRSEVIGNIHDNPELLKGVSNE